MTQNALWVFMPQVKGDNTGKRNETVIRIREDIKPEVLTVATLVLMKRKGWSP
jgi:hypothetical protein